MPRTFDFATESPASVEQLRAAFGDEEYWGARFAAFGGVTTLDSLTTEADGVITVATTQDLSRDRLPRAIARVLPGELKLRRTERWRPIDGRRVRGSISFVVPGGFGTGRAAALLTPIAAGTRLAFTVTADVKLPVVGRTLERYVCDQLCEQLPAFERFTTGWIADHTFQ